VALELSEKLLEFEPDNKMIHEYQVNIKKFIDQGTCYTRLCAAR
jgi:hypothetical protein